MTLSFSSLAADTVRLTGAIANLVVNGKSGGSDYSLNLDKPSDGVGTSETDPLKVYVPISSTAFTDTDGNSNNKYFSLYQSGITSIFDATNPAHVIHFPLTTSANSGTLYLYAATRVAAGSTTNTDYKVFKRYSNALSGTQDITYFDISPLEICSLYVSGPDCTSILPTNSANASKVTFEIYFFLSSTSNLTNSTIVPASYAGGIFVNVLVSNKVYPNSSLNVFLTNPKKGDGRIIVDYDANSTMDSFKKILVFQHSTSTPAQTNQAIGAYSGSIINRDFSTSPSGTLTINQLTNGTPVTISLAFKDNYGFATALSDDVTETPTQIEELLKKQACFLLTAGFGEEHYVISYFRHYRDGVLAHSWLGQRFIKFYYGSAPHYALIIYKHEAIRSAIRGFAYTLYFFFKYYWAVLLFFAGLISIILRKNKIPFSKNRL